MAATHAVGLAHAVCDRTRRVRTTTLVERLGSRLGREAVVGVRLRPEAQPELSWHYDPLVGGGRRRSWPSSFVVQASRLHIAGGTPAPQVIAAAAAAIVAAAAVVGGHVDRARRAAAAFPPRQPRNTRSRTPGGRSGSRPAGGAAGRWAATTSAWKPRPAAAFGSSAGCGTENGFCTEVSSERD